MKTIYFMRHGLTVMNVAGLRSGATETPLTDDGREAVRATGMSAVELGIDTIICSTLGRAVETAQIVASAINYPSEKIQTPDLLIERSFGQLEGKPYSFSQDIENTPEAEPLEVLFERTQKAITHIESLPGNTILVVGHGSSGRALRHLLNPTIPFDGSLQLENAQIIRLR